MNGQMDGQTEGWMGRWMGGWVHSSGAGLQAHRCSSLRSSSKHLQHTLGSLGMSSVPYHPSCTLTDLRVPSEWDQMGLEGSFRLKRFYESSVVPLCALWHFFPLPHATHGCCFLGGSYAELGAAAPPW